MARKLKVKSSKYIKIKLKIESYTENKPKIYQIYTECWTESKRRPPLCKEASPL